MTANKDFKRRVRARMDKTGESYTSARLQLLRKPAAVLPTPTPTPPPAQPAYAKLAGMSDATIKAKTGCNWERWVWALDRVKAHEWPHRDIAEYVHKKYKVPDWWTQWVTTGYERIKGLRAIGQRRGGSFEVNKSKVFPVPVARLYRRFAGAGFTVRKAIRNKSMRITWTDGTPVALYFLSKGPAKSSVSIQHRKLPDRATATKLKEFWTEMLEQV